MGKYMFIYRCPVTPPNQVTEQESAAQLDEWLAWEARVGTILIDDGAPFEHRACVRGDGSLGVASELQATESLRQIA